MCAVRFIVLVLAVAVSASAQNPPEYELEYLGAATHVSGLNNTGRVIGATLGGTVEAWVWSAQTGVVLLPKLPGSSYTQALDINDAGDIVGQAGTQPVVWRREPGGYAIETLAANGIARAINNQGDIVGVDFMWPVWFNSPTGVFNLGATGFTGTPYDINEERQIIGGWSPHRLDLDDMTLFNMGTPPSGPSGSYNGAYLYAINNGGAAVGFGSLATSLPDNQKCIRYKPGAGWRDLDNLPGPYNTAAGISDSGLIVTAIPLGLYVEGAGLFRIDGLLAGGNPGWTFNGWYGVDINDRDEIALIGSNSATGQSGAVLLKPVRPITPGDINGDGVVNFDDVEPFVRVLIGMPMAPEHVARSDLNKDGTADGRDMRAFLSLLIAP